MQQSSSKREATSRNKKNTNRQPNITLKATGKEEEKNPKISRRKEIIKT